MSDLGFRPGINVEDAALEAALLELYKKSYLVETLAAQAEQFELARECRETQHVDGVGECTRRVHAQAFTDWAIKEGSPEVWQDKTFNRYYNNLAPETVVESRSNKIQVGWTPAVDGEAVPVRQVRFSKTYGEKR